MASPACRASSCSTSSSAAAWSSACGYSSRRRPATSVPTPTPTSCSPPTESTASCGAATPSTSGPRWTGAGTSSSGSAEHRRYKGPLSALASRRTLGAQRCQPRADLLEASALRELAERPAIGRGRVRLLATELLHAAEAQQKLLVVEILRAEARQRHLEGFNSLRIVVLGLPRIGHAALAEHPQCPGCALGHRKLIGPARLGILLRLVTEIPQLIRHLGGAATRGILREGRFEIPDRRSSRVDRRLRAERRLSPGQGLSVRGHRTVLRAGVPVPAAGAQQAHGHDRGESDEHGASRRQRHAALR